MSFTLSMLPKILFLDIETASEYKDYRSVPEPFKVHWAKKCKAKRWLEKDPNPDKEVFADLYGQKSGIFAEFAQIVCISVGIVQIKNGGIDQLRIKSFANENELKVLEAFIQLLKGHFHNPNVHFLCGHNLREFDVPFLCRRMLIGDLPLPEILDVAGKRPWQIPQILDTMEMWKFGDYKHFTSLDLLCSLFGFESPKESMDGSMVGEKFWMENDLEGIARYCESDVISLVRLFLKLNSLGTLEEDQIQRIDS